MNWFRTRWQKLERSEKRYLIFLCVFALTLRLVYALSVDLIPADMYGIDMDAVDYDFLGWNIANGNGVIDIFGNPNSTRFPAYLYFLGTIYFILGRSHIIVLLIQAFIGVLTPLFIYLTAKQIFKNKVSRIAGILAAIYPVWIWYVGWLMTENLFLLLLNILIYLTVSLSRNAGWKKLLLIGSIVGLLSLTRGVGLPFLGIIPIYVFLRLKGDIAQKLGRAILVLLAALVVMTPWTIRNYIVYDEIMLPSSEGPGIMWLTLNADKVSIDKIYQPELAFEYVDQVGRQNATSEEFYWILAQHNPFGLTALQEIFERLWPDEPVPETDLEACRRLGEKVKVQILEQPSAWIIKSLVQIPRFWHVLDERGRYINGYGFIIPFFFVGFWLNRKRVIELLPLYIFPLELYAISILFFADARFRMPFEGVFLIVGAFAIERFITLFRKTYWAYIILAAFFLLQYYLRLQSTEVRMAIRSLLQAVGFQPAEL